MMNNIDKKIQRLQEQIDGLKSKSNIAFGIRAIGNKIEHVAKQIDELKKERESESKFYKGDWVYHKTPAYTWLVKFNRIENDHIYGSLAICLDDGDFHSDYCNRVCGGARKATPKEIEQALRSEWNRRCKEAGWESGEEAEFIDVEFGDTCKYDNIYGYEYFPRTDTLYCGSGVAYHKGVFATPKTKKSDRFYQWKLNYNRDKVNIGCKTYDKQYLSEIITDLKNIWRHNKSIKVNELIRELDKLDL